MPVYNAGAYLSESLDSFLAGADENSEIVCVDDGSTDGSQKTLESYGEKISYHRQPHRGVNAARNQAVKLSRGEYLMFLDADDMCAPGRAAAQREAFRENPAPDIVFGRVQEFISPELPERERKKFSCSTVPVPACVPGAMMIRKDSFLNVGFFKEDLGLASFMEWYARAQEAGLRVKVLEETVLCRRIHGGNFSVRERAQLGSEYTSTLKNILDRRRGKIREEAAPSFSPGKARLNSRYEKLLKAAFSKTDAGARDLGNEWQTEQGIEDIDPQSVRIIPLLLERFPEIFETPLKIKFKSVYNRNWYLNQILFHEIKPVLETAGREGGKFFLSGGAGTAAAFYKDYGLRLVDDFDVAVADENFSDALHFSKKAGWSLDPGGLRSPFIPACRGISFYKTSPKHPALRWRLVVFKPAHEFWKEIRKMELQGSGVFVLSPAAQLFYTCAYGPRWGRPAKGWRPGPLIQWAADILRINASGDVDWDRFLDLAEHYGNLPVIRQVIEYFGAAFSLSIPAGALERLRTKAPAGEVSAVCERADAGVTLDFWIKRTFFYFKERMF